MSETKISLCMIVRDEADCISDALDSVRPLVSEMIVVDTGSLDDTARKAGARGAKVFDFEWSGSFADARNESLRHATGDWIIILDADERIIKRDADSIRAIVTHSPPAAYVMNQWTYLYDSAIVGWTKNPGVCREASRYPGYMESRQVRLFPNHRGIRYAGDVHEGVEKSCAEQGITVFHANVNIHHFGRVYDGRRLARKGKLYVELGMKKVTANATDVHSADELATQLYEMGHVAQVREIVEKVLALEPMDRRALSLLGKTFMREGRYNEAVKVFAKLTETHPGFSDGWATRTSKRDFRASPGCTWKRPCASIPPTPTHCSTSPLRTASLDSTDGRRSASPAPPGSIHAAAAARSSRSSSFSAKVNGKRRKNSSSSSGPVTTTSPRWTCSSTVTCRYTWT